MFVFTNKEVIKMSFTYTMTLYSVIKKIKCPETIKFAGKWMRLESLVSSEVTRPRRINTACALM